MRGSRNDYPPLKWSQKVIECTLQAQDAPLNEAAIRLGVSLRQTEDQLTRDMLAATSGQINCVGGVNGDSPTEITVSDVQAVTTTLLTNNAYTILDNIEGENKFGTAPVRDSYMCFSHTNMAGQLNNVQGFTHKNNYPSQTNIGRSEWGSIQNLRFWISSVGSMTPASSFMGADVYNNFVTGMESYCYIEQDHLSATFIYRPAIYDGPLALNASVGYKFGACPRLLNDLWLFNLRCTLA